MKKLFELEKTPSVEAQTWPIDKLIFYAPPRFLQKLAWPLLFSFRPPTSRIAQVVIPGDLCGPAARAFRFIPTTVSDALQFNSAPTGNT